jgi:hypothetical protein
MANIHIIFPEKGLTGSKTETDPAHSREETYRCIDNIATTPPTCLTKGEFTLYTLNVHRG